jgi:hypothetical protein
MIQSVTKAIDGKKTHTLAWGAIALAGLQAAGILPKEWHGTDLSNVVSDHLGISTLIAAGLSFLRSGIASEGDKIRAAIARTNPRGCLPFGFALDASGNVFCSFTNRGWERNSNWDGADPGTGPRQAHLWKLNAASGAVMWHQDLGPVVSCFGVDVNTAG